MGEKNIDKVFEFFFNNRNSASSAYRAHGIKHKELSMINQVLLAGLEGDPSILDALRDVLERGA